MVLQLVSWVGYWNSLAVKEYRMLNRALDMSTFFGMTCAVENLYLGFMWLRIGTWCVGSCEHSNERFGSIEDVEFTHSCRYFMEFSLVCAVAIFC
jgi:hypothetical protein